MPAKFSGWTLPSVPGDDGPTSGDQHKPDTQIDFTPTWGRETWDEAGNFSQDAKGARQDVPYEWHPYNKETDINPAFGRVDVNDPDPVGGVPEPFCDMPGQTIDFESVGDRAADNDHGKEAPDGSGGTGYGGFVAPHIHD